MALKISNNTHFTNKVRTLLDKIYGRSILKDSVLERAIDYFEQQPITQRKAEALQFKLDEVNQNLAANEGSTNTKKKDELARLERDQKDFLQLQRLERSARNKHLQEICDEVIDLCESDDINETNRRSAQLLGSIQLMNPSDGKNLAKLNEVHKPLYKAVLCLRLLDRLCLDKAVVEPYVKYYLGDITPEQYATFASIDNEAYQRFLRLVKVPLVMAAIVQDIGNYHPDAQAIMCGADGKQDQYRTLDMENRKNLLQINYRETINYLLEGVGVPRYIGNSRAERDRFVKVEHKKLVFVKHLIKSSINPQKGIGNLLKVPQIYTSIVLSTKANYNYKLLPKVYQALNQNAERGSCSQAIVDSLYRITGMFPQGFGITYIPRDADGQSLDRYEYAIVNQLYPEDPEQPLCRIATKQLTFISIGFNLVIKQQDNLYFAQTAKKLATISKARLREILELLVSNYLEREQLDLVPRCWHGDGYFSIKGNQKLWHKIQ
jgi:hypothetical protein